MKTTLALGLLLLAFNTYATLSYYPRSTIEMFNDPSTNSARISNEIFELSEKYHLRSKDQHDTLVEVCPANADCLRQKRDMTYEEARKILFGDLYLEKKSNGRFMLKEVYCNITIDESAGVGPNKIPNPNVVNCEHTWPQSKFSKKFPSDLQKSDLHHIFPSDMKANSTRNNFPFADVYGTPTHARCNDSRIGNAINTNIRSFEPPIEHKGNVARAIFYFSARYKMDIDSTQGHYLKLWNEEDPVDQAERERNNKIMELQGNRNPFIDYPELINRL